MLVSLGKIVVASAGTPVQVSATSLNVNTAFFQVVSGQSGAQMYIGLLGLTKASLVKVLRVLQKPLATPGINDSWTVQGTVTMAPIDLSAIYIDADTTNDALLVSYLI
jgi:hypothetical protein